MEEVYGFDIVQSLLLRGETNRIEVFQKKIQVKVNIKIFI
jgi:hypothetical protein